MQDVLVCAGQRTRNLSTDVDWREKVRLVFERLSENERRWVAGLFAQAVGWGGEAFAAAVTGLDPKTVRAGRMELENDLADCPTGRLPDRRHSPARRRATARRKKDPDIERNLKQLVEPETGGDACGRRTYVKSSPRSLAERLWRNVWGGTSGAERLGRVCYRIVGRLLRKAGFSPRTNVKRLTGPPSGPGPAVPVSAEDAVAVSAARGAGHQRGYKEFGTDRNFRNKGAQRAGRRQRP